MAVAGAAWLLMQPPGAAEAHHLCPSTGSPFGPFEISTYEAADYKYTYARTLELAGTNRLFPDIGSFSLPRVESGERNAGSGQTADPYIPPLILKSIAYNESGWAQASYSPLVDYGQIGPVLASHDCGYGLMQVTTGMQNISGVPNMDQAMIGSSFAFNAAKGARILADKWNMSPELRPVIGNRDPALIENWYYAIWGYNGWAFQNHPLNPAYSATRPQFSCGPGSDGLGHDKSQYPYQEIILGCIAHPPVKGGTRLWEPQEVHLPDFNDPRFSGPMAVTNWNNCSYSAQCAPMDIPTPNTNHRDPTAVTVTREQVIGAPALRTSADSLSVFVPPGSSTAEASITVSNSGSGVLGYRATTNASWAKAGPVAAVAVGPELGGGSSTVTVRINTAGLSPGVYTAQLKLESLYGGSRTVSINLTNGVPDGSLVRGSGPEVYKLFGNVRRHVPNLATFSALGFSFSNVIAVPDSQLAQYALGNPLLDVAADGRLVAGSGPAVYVMQGGLKRHVTSLDAMSACGYSFGAVSTLPDGVIAGLGDGPPLTGFPCPRFAPRDGTMLRGSGPAVYVIRSGIRRHVPSLITFEARGYRFENVDVVREAELQAIPNGNRLPDVGDSGNLVASPGDPAIYALDGGVRRHVLDLNAMSSCGYGFDAVTLLSAGTVNAIPEGSSLAGPPCPRVRFAAGSLVAGSGPAVSVVDASGNRRHIASLEAFGACAYQWGNVDVIPDSVLLAMPEAASVNGPPCPR